MAGGLGGGLDPQYGRTGAAGGGERGLQSWSGSGGWCPRAFGPVDVALSLQLSPGPKQRGDGKLSQHVGSTGCGPPAFYKPFSLSATPGQPEDLD